MKVELIDELIVGNASECELKKIGRPCCLSLAENYLTGLAGLHSRSMRFQAISSAKAAVFRSGRSLATYRNAR